MKRAFQAIAVLAAVIGFGLSNPAHGAPIGEALQSAMDQSIKDSGAVGVSAAVIFSNGESWAGTAGTSHNGVPLTTDMLFDIGSVEKNLQATLCLRLVEDGIIGLDDPLEKWLSPTANIGGAITVRQLLGMTSGIHDFVRDPNSPFRVGYVNIDFEKIWTWEEVQTVFGGEPSFEPGTKCEYSNTNYIVLRQIIERATQSGQSALAEERLLKPNGLSHTLVDMSRPVPATMRIAHGWFDTNDDGQPEDISGNSLAWIASLAPMLTYSTPSDMVEWMDALYHKKTVLKDETLEAMLDFKGPVIGEPLMKGYGLGVVDVNLGAIMPRWEKVRIYGHLGSSFGYSTLVGYFPEYGVSLAMMFNRGCDRATDKAINTVAGAVLDVLLRRLGAPESRQADSISDLTKQLERSPDDLHLMYKIATKHQASNDDYEASLVYEEMLKRDPEDKYGYRTEATFWKAVYDGLIWKKPEGLVAFLADHKDYKDLKNGYRWLAKTYLRRDEPDKGAQAYREALDVFGKDPELYNEYAWWVYENRVRSEYETALQFAKTATGLKPEAYYIWDTVAWLHFELGEHDLAVEASTRALSLAPESAREEMEKSLKKIKKAGT